MIRRRYSVERQKRSFMWKIVCKSGDLALGCHSDFLAMILIAKEEKARWVFLLPASRLRVQLLYPNGDRVSRADIQTALHALRDQKILAVVRNRVSAAARGTGLGVAQVVTCAAAESGFSVGFAKSHFCQAGVVAPPDSLTGETSMVPEFVEMSA